MSLSGQTRKRYLNITSNRIVSPEYKKTHHKKRTMSRRHEQVFHGERNKNEWPLKCMLSLITNHLNAK